MNLNRKEEQNLKCNKGKNRRRDDENRGVEIMKDKYIERFKDEERKQEKNSLYEIYKNIRSC